MVAPRLPHNGLGMGAARRITRIEADHGQPKLRPMHGVKPTAEPRSSSLSMPVPNIRRSHYELGVEEAENLRVLTALR
jgi:hypothetical protein